MMTDAPIFFDGFDGILRTMVAAGCLYLIVIASIRIMGKRSMAQMNNFDWIVTVAMGSLMASGIMLKDVTVAETTTAIGTLLVLQWVLTRLAQSSQKVAAVVQAEPVLLFHRGKFLHEAMRKERVTPANIRMAVRSSGMTRLQDVQWVILENDASMSVIPASEPLTQSDALDGVEGATWRREESEAREGDPAFLP